MFSSTIWTTFGTYDNFHTCDFSDQKFFASFHFKFLIFTYVMSIAHRSSTELFQNFSSTILSTFGTYNNFHTCDFSDQNFFASFHFKFLLFTYVMSIAHRSLTWFFKNFSLTIFTTFGTYDNFHTCDFSDQKCFFLSPTLVSDLWPSPDMFRTQSKCNPSNKQEIKSKLCRIKQTKHNQMNWTEANELDIIKWTVYNETKHNEINWI